MVLLPPAVQNRIWVLLIAAAVDLLLGDPPRLWHPVRGIGFLISISEKLLRKLFAVPPRERSSPQRERMAGLLMVLIVLTVSTGAAVFFLWLCGRVHPALRIAAEGFLCGRLLALRSLAEAGFSVRDPLLKKNTEEARKAVSMIVGRDTQRLDAEEIAKAAVETVAENTSDGVTAPLLYMFLAGGAGGIFYKAVNTMDSMTGYKNDRYRYFGTAAAKLDDVLNWLPSRITAFLMILVCSLPGKTSVEIRGDSSATHSYSGGSVPDGVSGSPDQAIPVEPGPSSCDFHREPPCTILIPDGAAAFRIWKRDRRKSPSPNSAQTESVCAGALHLRLLGDTWYFGELHHKAEIGDGGRRAEPEDITRAVSLMERTAVLLFAVGIMVVVLIGIVL